MSIYLAREWEVRALLSGRMNRIVVPHPVDVTDDVGESGPFDLDGGSYVSVSMG